MMNTTAPKPATTPIPVQLSATEFTAFIFPHLSVPKRGPKCKLGYHRLFNPTTSLESVDQICTRRIAALQSQATRESGFLPVHKSLLPVNFFFL